MTSWLFVTDVDGTLVDRQGRISDRDAAAIRAMRRRGVRVTLCTGRLYSGVRAIIESVRLIGPVACVDGGHIVDPSGERSLVHVPIPSDVAGRILDRILSQDLAPFAFCSDRVVHDASGEVFLPYITLWSPSTTCVESVLDHVHRLSHSLTLGVVGIGAQSTVHLAAEYIRVAHSATVRVDAFPVGAPTLAPNWVLLVRPAGVSKGTAVRWMADYYGIPSRSVVVVGDWVNDIPMMLVAGRSFAMAQAPPEVKASATDHLLSDPSSGGGIAEAAERCGLVPRFI